MKAPPPQDDAAPETTRDEPVVSAPGTLPASIAVMDRNDPVRKEWEKSHRQKDDGTWVKAAGAIGAAEEGLVLSDKQKKMIREIVVMAVIGVVCLAAVNHYRNTLHEKRAAVLTHMAAKGFQMSDPEVRAAYRAANMTLWLPELDRLLESLKGSRKRIATEEPQSNPEGGSYVDYIQRHNLPFDERDAMEWQARSMRAPISAKPPPDPSPVEEEP
ncbi:MAG: hypothetical protein HQL88_09420 [Magnetococcales bacterium]|nr:hypothetical protein [Magnetococcales bacterium]